MYQYVIAGTSFNKLCSLIKKSFKLANISSMRVPMNLQVIVEYNQFERGKVCSCAILVGEDLEI